MRWAEVNRYIESQKQDIGESQQDIQDPKQDIGESKQDIDIPDGIENKSKRHIRALFSEFGNDRFFGRKDVMEVLGLTASPSSALIKKMLNADIIHPIKGKGKGKYMFGK